MDVVKMKKNKVVGIIVTLLLVAVMLVTALLLMPNEEEIINEEIDDANYCTVDADCVDAGGKCPFGCYAYVNAAEVDKIRGLIQGFKSNCEYGCIGCPTAVCQEGKCKEVCDLP
jgi:hypothetical protein